MQTRERIPAKELSQAELQHFFVSHLNRIYCAKSQLAEKLSELSSRSHFLDLHQAIDETIEIVKNQIERLKEIYIKLDAWYEPESCIGVVGILDEAFQSIGVPGDTATVRDLSILFYMHNIESIEAASFKIMIMVSDKLPNPEISQLLLECYDESREDRMLFKQITENYL